MTKPNITIHDVETGEIISREMTDAEFEQWEIHSEKRAQAIAEETIKQENKQAILERLGLTDEELNTLLS